jgi:hypothetical protein
LTADEKTEGSQPNGSKHYQNSITKKNTEPLIDTSKEVGIEINVEKTKYMLLSCHQNVGQNQDIKIANRLFEKCVTVQIFVTDSNKSKFDSGGN